MSKKLREYKGVTYDDGKYRYCGTYGISAASLIAVFPCTFSDDDHAELMRLKAEPYEPTPTLEEIVHGWLKEEMECCISGSFPKIDPWRLIHHLRTAFPNIDKDDA